MTPEEIEKEYDELEDMYSKDDKDYRLNEIDNFPDIYDPVYPEVFLHG